MKKIVYFLLIALLCSGCSTSIMSTMLPGVFDTAPGYSFGWESCTGNASEGRARFAVACSHVLAPQTVYVLSGNDTYAADMYGNRYPVTVSGASSLKMAAGVPGKFVFEIRGIPPGVNSLAIISIMFKTYTDGVSSSGEYRPMHFRNIPITWQ